MIYELGAIELQRTLVQIASGAWTIGISDTAIQLDYYFCAL